MMSKATVVLLWCGATAAVAVVATQSAERTWMAYGWVIVSVLLAIGATVVRALGRKQERRMQSGIYD